MLSGSYYVLFCYSMVSIVLFLKEYVADRKNALAQQKSGLVFRRRIYSTVSDPDRAVWRRGTGSDEISGGHDDEPRAGDGRILKRTDAFMFSIWFFTLYAMLNSMVFYSGNLAEKVIRDCGGYLEGKKRMLPYLILLLLVYGVTGAVLQKSAVFGLRDIPAVEDWNTFCRWRAGTAVSDRREKKT